MSNFLDKPCRHSINSSREENEIREIFHNHWERMKIQMKTTIDDINKWRSQSIEEINQYADKQVRILKNYYDQQRTIFDKSRDENLDAAKAFHTSKQSHLFNELRNACGLLQFQVAQLETVWAQEERPRVITPEEQTRRMKQDKINTRALESENSQGRSITEDPNIMKRNEGDIARSSPNSISSISNERQ
jgi:hypothetical protein